jgi:hypothetical protein
VNAVLRNPYDLGHAGRQLERELAARYRRTSERLDGPPRGLAGTATGSPYPSASVVGGKAAADITPIQCTETPEHPVRPVSATARKLEFSQQHHFSAGAVGVSWGKGTSDAGRAHEGSPGACSYSLVKSQSLTGRFTRRLSGSGSCWFGFSVVAVVLAGFRAEAPEKAA